MVGPDILFLSTYLILSIIQSIDYNVTFATSESNNMFKRAQYYTSLNDENEERLTVSNQKRNEQRMTTVPSITFKFPPL